jgi:hypothetical protein
MQKYGLEYYFFTDEEIVGLFDGRFALAHQEVNVYDSRSDPGENLALVYTLFTKPEL